MTDAWPLKRETAAPAPKGQSGGYLAGQGANRGPAWVS